MNCKVSALRKRVALLLLLAAVALPLQAWRACAEDAPKAEDWSVAPLLPPDTLAVVTSPDARKLTDKFKQTGVWQLYSNPDVQKAFRTPLMTAQMGIAAVELQAGIKVHEILSWLNQGEATFALLNCEHRNENNEPVPDLLISLQAREKTQAVLDEISKRIDQLNAQAGNQLDITQTPVGNYTVHRVGHVAVPFSISYTVCDGQVILTLGEGYIEKILALHERAKGGPLQPGAKPETLAQTAGFGSTLKKSPDADLLAYVNWEGLRGNAILNVKPHNDREQADWQLLGLDSVRAFSYALTAKGPGLREVLYLDIPANARKGVPALFDGAAGLNPSVLAQTPRNAVAAVALNIAPDKLADKIADIASIDTPTAHMDIEQLFANLSQQLKIDVKTQLFAGLSGQATFSVAMLAKNPKLPVAMPQALLTLQVKDAAALKSVLDATRTALADKFEFTDTTVGDNTLVTMREKFPEGHKPRQIAYTLDKTDLLVALYPLALRDELSRRHGANAGSPSDKPKVALTGSLADDEDFKSASATVSGTPQFLFYADTGAIATALYDTLIPIAQLEPKPPQVDVSALPSADVLVQNLAGTIFGVNSDNDGVTISGYSPTGVVGLFALAVPAAIKNRRNAGGGGAGGGAMQQRKRTVLDAISQGLQAYAKDNGGKFPAAVKELQPKYIPQLTTELQFVEYLGKQDKANKVVAHSSEKLPGPITVLLQDGTVAEIRRDQLGKTLRDGYSPDAAAGMDAPKAAPDF